MSLVDCFRAIINKNFHLGPAKPSGVVVKDMELSAVNSSLTFIGGKDISSFGFVAETMNPEPLALLASTSTPSVGLSGVRKMCDGIVIFSIGNREYILCVELKSGKTKSAHMQIKNGKILCEWLIELLKEYGHWSGSYKFFGILSKSSRKIINKGTTRHNDYLEPCEDMTLMIRNHKKVYLVHIAAHIDQL